MSETKSGMSCLRLRCEYQEGRDQNYAFQTLEALFSRASMSSAEVDMIRFPNGGVGRRQPTSEMMGGMPYFLSWDISTVE